MGLLGACLMTCEDVTTVFPTQSLKLQDDKLSGLFSIVKAVHLKSTTERLQVWNGWVFSQVLPAFALKLKALYTFWQSFFSLWTSVCPYPCPYPCCSYLRPYPPVQVDLSFQYCKDLLLAHSVQRPPYSIGLFTLPEMKALLSWMLDTYYRHYKLYMYAFTDRCGGRGVGGGGEGP